MTSSPGAVFYSVRCLFWIISEGIFICCASLLPVPMVWVLTSRLDAPECALDRIRCALCCHVSPLSLRHQTRGRVEKNIQFIEKKGEKRKERSHVQGFREHEQQVGASVCRVCSSRDYCTTDVKELLKDKINKERIPSASMWDEHTLHVISSNKTPTKLVNKPQGFWSSACCRGHWCKSESGSRS